MRAASNCNSPSKSKSTFLSVKIALAIVTLSTNSCLALPKVENESKATFGSSPIIALRVIAVLIVMSASCSELGLGTTAQSANKKILSSPRKSETGKIKALETVLNPGITPITCNAALKTSAVLFTAPATIPSTCFSLTIKAP